MASIDIGSEAINRPSNWGTIRTLICGNNSANLTGKITSIEVYCSLTAISNCEVATFFNVSGNNFSTRSTQSIGSLSLGYNKFNVDLDVEAGDYIGIFFDGGYIDFTSDVGTSWHLLSDQIPCTNVTFIETARTISLYGTGVTPTANTIIMGANF